MVITKREFGRFFLYDLMISSLVYGSLKKYYSSDLIAIFGSFTIPTILKNVAMLLEGNKKDAHN